MGFANGHDRHVNRTVAARYGRRPIIMDFRVTSSHYVTDSLFRLYVIENNADDFQKEKVWTLGWRFGLVVTRWLRST